MKLVLVDEFDREYKRQQRPVVAVAKTGQSLHLSNTLRDRSITDDRKVREYVAALHRYLNVCKQVPAEPKVETVLGTPAQQPMRGRRRRRQHRPWSLDPLLRWSTLRLPGSLGSVRNESKKFLAGRDAYTLHKSRWIRFGRRETYLKGIADLFQVDLVDLSNLASYNDGMRYLLTCIDVLSKQAWAVPVRRKSARDVAEGFENIMAEGCKPNIVQSDKGTEFLNSSFQSMLRRHDIHFYTSENEVRKCCRRGTLQSRSEGKDVSILHTYDTWTRWTICCIGTIIRIIDRSE